MLGEWSVVQGSARTISPAPHKKSRLAPPAKIAHGIEQWRDGMSKKGWLAKKVDFRPSPGTSMPSISADDGLDEMQLGP
jgi:hypothetical protein